MQSTLIPGRECGSCDVCCVALTIDDPELQKLPGHPCGKLSPGCGCSVYETRPKTCRTYYCGWRQLKWLGGGLRPDQSGLLVRLVPVGTPPAPPNNPAIEFVILDRKALAADGLAEAVAAAIHSKVTTCMAVPGPPGFGSAGVALNEKLADAVRRKDKKSVLRTLRRTFDQCSGVPTAPVKLTGGGAPASEGISQ